MSTKITAALGCLFLLFTASLGAAEQANVCPCVPAAPHWTATPCETWTCASAAMILAAGDPTVFAVPTNSKQFPWVVLRRVGVEGAMISSPDQEPFEVESFTTLPEGSGRFDSIDHSFMPMLMTTTDGLVLVVHLRTPAPAHNRAAGH